MQYSTSSSTEPSNCVISTNNALQDYEIINTNESNCMLPRLGQYNQQLGEFDNAAAQFGYWSCTAKLNETLRGAKLQT